MKKFLVLYLNKHVGRKLTRTYAMFKKKKKKWDNLYFFLHLKTQKRLSGVDTQVEKIKCKPTSFNSSSPAFTITGL